MSVLSKKLHVMKTGGADIAISLYTTAGECAEPNLKLLVDGTQAYAKLGSVSDSNATPLRVYRNSDKETYAVLKEAETALASMNMTAGSHSDNQGTYYGFDSVTGFGSMSGNTINYGGATYVVNYLATANASYTRIGFESVPSFNTITLSINGTKMTATKGSWLKMIFDFPSAYGFVAGQSYSVKILSVS